MLNVEGVGRLPVFSHAALALGAAVEMDCIAQNPARAGR
jgi:hypothetical protein